MKENKLEWGEGKERERERERKVTTNKIFPRAGTNPRNLDEQKFLKNRLKREDRRSRMHNLAGLPFGLFRSCLLEIKWFGHF